MTDNMARAYLANPCYAPVGGPVTTGWAALVASLAPGISVAAVDGPVIARWPEVVHGLGAALASAGWAVKFIDTSEWLLPWEQVQKMTSSPELADDPDFDRLPSVELADLLQVPSELDAPPGHLVVVHGPGAALAPHDVLCYADLPKRYAEAAIGAGTGLNLGQAPGSGPGTAKRLFFSDWPLLDRHRDRVIGQAHWWADMQGPAEPTLIDGATLRATLGQLAVRPFRTRPTFNTTPWGGHWGQSALGHNPGALNTALGYELIAPEAGVLVGTDSGPKVELPFQLMVSRHPEAVLGGDVHAVFGTSFPVRFDYLDTLGGGNLSVHCHPRPDYMSSVFGWPYTQHESYYVMVGAPTNEIFLGLREDADIEQFHREADGADQDGRPLDISRYVPSFPATPHQLFLIPGGTPHGSGRDNVVLEISATPYLYSLRFYDWLRRGADGQLRPVHVAHAFNNLNLERRGQTVARDLVQQPRVLRRGDGWLEEVLGSLPELFFEVRRLVLQPGAAASDATATSFHVLNVVEGEGVVIEATSGASHVLVYAETLVVPAAVGPYTLKSLGAGGARVVKALVR